MTIQEQAEEVQKCLMKMKIYNDIEEISSFINEI